MPYIPFMQNFGKGKTIWMENRSVVAKGWLGGDGTDYKGAQKVISKVLEMFCMVP